MKTNAAIIGLSLLVLVLFCDHLVSAMERFQVKGQMQTIVTLRDGALASHDIRTVVSHMDYILSFTPSLGKKARDPTVNLLLTHFRDDAIAAMVAHLRMIAQQDLGPDPAVWIRAYPSPKGIPLEDPIRPGNGL